MYEIKNTRRVTLLKELLIELKESHSQLARLAEDLESMSGVFYSEAYVERSMDIQSEMDKYNSNNARVAAANRSITAKVNEWFEFTKNKSELAKITYPLAFWFKKRALKKFIEKTNDEISAITINNRFIKEKLTLLEHQLEISAIEKMKADEKYLSYDKLSTKLELLETELKYLIPTIPDLCLVNISISNIDTLLGKLADIEAA